MQIAKPQVHLRHGTVSGSYFIHVVTWFNSTIFVSDGISSIGTTASSGVFPIVLQVAEAAVPEMALLTPVVHTLELEEVTLDSEDPFIDVIIINTSDSNAEVGRRRVHKDDADDSSMPSPRQRKPVK
jgi:hypothetical protein